MTTSTKKKKPFAYELPEKKEWQKPEHVPQTRIDTLKIEAKSKTFQNLSRDRSKWVLARDEAYKNYLNISNIEKTIENEDTDASLIFQGHEWEKWL